MAYNDSLERARKLMEGSTGMNSYNRTVSGGTGRIAAGTDALTQKAAEMFTRNPGALRESLYDISQNTARELADLELNATKEQASINATEAGRLTNIGLTMEQLDRADKARKEQNKLDLVSSLVGGLLTGGTSLIGAGIARAGQNKLAEALMNQPKQTAEYPNPLKETEALLRLLGILPGQQDQPKPLQFPPLSLSPYSDMEIQ